MESDYTWIFDESSDFFTWSEDDWERTEDSNYHGGTTESTFKIGAYVDFSISGPAKFILRGTKTNGHGSFEILINDTVTATGSGYSDLKFDENDIQPNKTIYESEALSEGWWNVRYQNIGPRGKETGSWIVLDSLEYIRLDSKGATVSSTSTSTEPDISTSTDDSSSSPMSMSSDSDPTASSKFGFISSSRSSTNFTIEDDATENSASTRSNDNQDGGHTTVHLAGLVAGVCVAVVVFSLVVWYLLRRRHRRWPKGAKSAAWHTEAPTASSHSMLMSSSLEKSTLHPADSASQL